MQLFTHIYQLKLIPPTGNNSKPASIVHYDSFEREIRNGELRFDGSWQFVDKIYDRRGKYRRYLCLLLVMLRLNGITMNMTNLAVQ